MQEADMSLEGLFPLPDLMNSQYPAIAPKPPALKI
jgi:hypothetical protein